MGGWLAALALVGSGCGVVFPLREASPDAAGDAISPDTGTPPRKLVFVTNQGFAGSALGGLAGADAKCNAEAMQAGRSGTFMAWLSDSTGSPSSRFTRGSGYQLVNGGVVANSFEDLTDGTLLAAIAFDANGGSPFVNFVCTGAEVWTNTNVNGEAGLESCGDWSTGGNGAAGHFSRVDAGWTIDCDSIGCTTALPIYCFEQ